MTLIIIGENDSRSVHAGLSVKWPFKITTDSAKVTMTFGITTGPDGADAPEWTVTLYDKEGELWDNYGSKTEVKIDPAEQKDFFLEVTCPKGARYGDTVSVVVKVSGEGEEDAKEFIAGATQSIMILKTQIGQEVSVVDSLALKANLGQKDIYAILSPATLRGYVFVEGMNTDRMHEKIKDIKKAKGFVTRKDSVVKRDKRDRGYDETGEVSLDGENGIGHYLTPISTVVGIVEGDLVELVNGPFKGEKARVQQIDKDKEEITVELIEAMVPIPVTVKGDSVRVIEKEK